MADALLYIIFGALAGGFAALFFLHGEGSKRAHRMTRTAAPDEEGDAP